MFRPYYYLSLLAYTLLAFIVANNNVNCQEPTLCLSEAVLESKGEIHVLDTTTFSNVTFDVTDQLPFFEQVVADLTCIKGSLKKLLNTNQSSILKPALTTPNNFYYKLNELFELDGAVGACMNFSLKIFSPLLNEDLPGVLKYFADEPYNVSKIPTILFAHGETIFTINHDYLTTMSDYNEAKVKQINHFPSFIKLDTNKTEQFSLEHTEDSTEDDMVSVICQGSSETLLYNIDKSYYRIPLEQLYSEINEHLPTLTTMTKHDIVQSHEQTKLVTLNPSKEWIYASEKIYDLTSPINWEGKVTLKDLDDITSHVQTVKPIRNNIYQLVAGNTELLAEQLGLPPSTIIDPNIEIQPEKTTFDGSTYQLKGAVKIRHTNGKKIKVYSIHPLNTQSRLLDENYLVQGEGFQYVSDDYPKFDDCITVY